MIDSKLKLFFWINFQINFISVIRVQEPVICIQHYPDFRCNFVQ
jgi:hypothetical protein